MRKVIGIIKKNLFFSSASINSYSKKTIDDDTDHDDDDNDDYDDDSGVLMWT